jgi:hypothetical protein
LLATIAITVGACRFHQTDKAVIENEVRTQLLAVADLKVRQLTDWREERLGDAHVLMAHRMMMPAIERILAGSAGARQRDEVLAWLTSICEHPHYADALLTNRRGEVVLKAGRTMGPEGHVEEIAREVFRKGEPVPRDFHAGHPGYPAHLGMNLPLAWTAQSPPLGALLLGIDPTEHLYPLIQSWPAPSRSAETLLVRREGNQVVYLNDLRHRKNAALTLTVPLTRTGVPAV